MLIIPLKPAPNQTLTTVLANQNCRINVYQKFFGLYMDLAIGDAPPIILGNICQNANPIVRYAYLGFVGDLAFFDSQGEADPYYSGLGSRWQLAYLQGGT